jgi:hypothetical protein
MTTTLMCMVCRPITVDVYCCCKPSWTGWQLSITFLLNDWWWKPDDNIYVDLACFRRRLWWWSVEGDDFVDHDQAALLEGMKYYGANKRWRWWFIVHMNERSCCLQRSVATIEDARVASWHTTERYCKTVLRFCLRNLYLPIWVLVTNAFTALSISYDTCWISQVHQPLARLPWMMSSFGLLTNRTPNLANKNDGPTERLMSGCIP